MKDFTIFNHTFKFLTEERQWIKLQDILRESIFDNTFGRIAVLLVLVVFLGFLLSLILHGVSKKVLNVVLLLAYVSVLALMLVVGKETARGIRVFNTAAYITDTGFHESRVLITLINCMLFIPLGIFLRKASGRGKAILNVLLILLMALGIEIAQYVFAKGYTALEDVLVFFIGGCIGLLLAAPFCLLAEYLERRAMEKSGRRGNRYDRYE